MNLLMLILQVALLYAFSLIGVWLQNLLDLSIPGSIIGMMVLFLFLIFKIVPVKIIEKGSQFLNAYLPVFFIPATVGVMDYYQLFIGSGIMLVFITTLSTLIVMILSGKTSQYLSRRRGFDTKETEGEACQKQS